jgi:hypothetical protein
MARKQKGYVELYWECPNCSGENLGSAEICGNCGKPQPQNVDFYQGSHQEIIKDEGKIKRAKAGADIHCGYCGNRNPGDAKKCTQCGASLSEGAQRKSAGRLVGSFTQGKGGLIKCPNCGRDNAYVNRKCHNCGVPLSHKQKKEIEKESKPPKRNVLVMIGFGLLFACAAIYFLFLRTSDVSGTVTGAEWNRSVVIEEFGAVEKEDWFDQIPAEGEVLSCTEKVREVQYVEPIGARYDEVCGTPYTVETGSGFAEVVQDCEYQVYDDSCTYSAMDWATLRTVELDGNNFSPLWPSPSLTSDQRFGDTSESYACIFESGGDIYTYTADSLSEFEQCAMGSTWTLSINALGAVSSIDR